MSSDSSMSDIEEVTSAAYARAAAAAASSGSAIHSSGTTRMSAQRAVLYSSMPSLTTPPAVHETPTVPKCGSERPQYPCVTMYDFSPNNPEAVATRCRSSTPLGAFTALHGLSTLRTWITDNVMTPLATPLFNRDAQRLVAFNSREGTGVRTMLTMACQELGIDLLVVKPTWRRDGMLAHIVDYATENQCMVLFDRCDVWFDQKWYDHIGSEWVMRMTSRHDDEHRAELLRTRSPDATMFRSGRLNMPGKQSWMVFSTVAPFQMLHPNMQSLFRLRFIAMPPFSVAEAIAIITDYYANHLRLMGYRAPETLERNLRLVATHSERIALAIEQRTPGTVISLLEETRDSANIAADRAGYTPGDLRRLPRAEDFEATVMRYDLAASHVSAAATTVATPPPIVQMSQHQQHYQQSQFKRPNKRAAYPVSHPQHAAAETSTRTPLVIQPTTPREQYFSPSSPSYNRHEDCNNRHDEYNNAFVPDAIGIELYSQTPVNQTTQFLQQQGGDQVGRPSSAPPR